MSTKSHAEIARWLLEEARTMPRNNDETSPAETLAIATAQVHATLALVEQQRIANLLTAFGTYERWPSRPEGKSFNHVREYLASELRDGLGLA